MPKEQEQGLGLKVAGELWHPIFLQTNVVGFETFKRRG